MTLDREEYVEQAYFFRAFRERVQEGTSSQELLAGIRQEILSTTKLPMALEFMAGEQRLTGSFGSAMARLHHYFSPFQTFVIREAEKEEGRLDFRIALEILQREAEYRAQGGSVQGIFLYQFETLCRNRLGYDRGLDAMAADTVYDEAWREWILAVRRQVGIIDIADIIYVRSQHYRNLRGEPEKPILFGEKEGRIALANRRKDPLFLFAALARHLGYPSVPRPKPQVSEAQQFALLQRRLDRVENRLRLMEEELRGGIDLSRYYGPPKEEKP